MSLITFGRALSLRLRAIARDDEGSDRGRFPQRINPPIPVRRAVAGLEMRWFCLASDLQQGGTCTCTDIDDGTSFEAEDALNEFFGTAGIHSGIAVLKDWEGDGTGTGTGSGANLWRIIRLVCPDFEGGCPGDETGTGTGTGTGT